MTLLTPTEYRDKLIYRTWWDEGFTIKQLEEVFNLSEKKIKETLEEITGRKINF